MDRFQEFKAFVAVAETGGFGKAAARLRSSPPAVTRAIASIEGRLGVQLFNRTTRSVHLTEPGLRFLERARNLLAEIDQAEKEATGETSIPSGHLTLTASVTMGQLFLLSIVTGFHKTHPLVSSKLLLLDRVVNLVEEGIDVGLRVGQLPDSSLISRHVGDVRRILVASPAYLAKRGAPRAPADLKVHSIIAFTGLMPNREWTFGAGRTAKRIALAPRLEINDAAAAIAAAEEGHGVTIALRHMVAKQIEKGRLVHVLEADGPPPVPVQLVYPETRLVTPKVRAFIDYAAPRLRAALHDLDSSVPHAAAETARTRRGPEPRRRR